MNSRRLLAVKNWVIKLSSPLRHSAYPCKTQFAQADGSLQRDAITVLARH
jgi:hypothetical protein